MGEWSSLATSPACPVVDHCLGLGGRMVLQIHHDACLLLGGITNVEFTDVPSVLTASIHRSAVHLGRYVCHRGLLVFSTLYSGFSIDSRANKGTISPGRDTTRSSICTVIYR